jgi:hypothetical protein
MAISENSVLKQVYLNLDLDKSLKKLANASNLTESEIIILALEKYLNEKKAETAKGNENFLLSIAGLGKNGPTNGAKYHDKYIYGRK